MKQKKIERLINDSGVLGFDFENNEACVTWWVTPGAGKMLARRMVEYDYDWQEVNYFAVPYADLEAVDSLYEDIVIDFVEFYLDDLRAGTGSELSLFDDLASAHDEGLAQMLSFFGKTYGEFLNDVFYWFSVINETDEIVEESDECEEDSEATERGHLIRKVLDHLGSQYLCFDFSDRGVGYFWRFAQARGKIWYSCVDVVYDDRDYFVGTPGYDCVDMDDIDAMEALRDAIRAMLDEDGWILEDCGETLDMLGLGLDDM